MDSRDHSHALSIRGEAAEKAASERCHYVLIYIEPDETIGWMAKRFLEKIVVMRKERHVL
jgi:hypothetical protein